MVPHSLTPGDSLLTSVFKGEIGLAREDITPPPGIYARNWGLSRYDTADGVHRPLTATVLALVGKGDAPPLLLVAADLGWWKSRDDERRVRGGLQAALGLSEAQVLISLSHTHAGPSLYSDDAGKPGGEWIGPYLDRLRERLIAAARAAMAVRRPALLSWRYGRCDLARNRDLPEPGTARHVVGYHAEGSADDTLLVGRIEDAADGRLLGTVVNYACHPTTLAWDNRLISPDFPGAMRETVEAATGAPSLFLQGASGELAPAEQYCGDAAVADRHGRRLGHAVLAVLNGWSERTQVFDRVVESGAALAVTRPAAVLITDEASASVQPVSLPLKPMPTVAEIEAKLAGCTDRALGERLWRQRGVRRMVGDGAALDLPLWIWRVGEAWVVASPGEAYSQLQTEVRRRFPGRPIVVLNVTNGYAGYLAPQDHATRDQYSVWQSPFTPGALETLVLAVQTRLLRALEMPAAAPLRPPSP
ncbi:MAG: hypothetical protein U1F61_15225 [Opitutaceae bacterium]